MSVELYIEKWSAPIGEYLYPWSVWQNGKQIHYGQRLKTPEEAEQQGMHYCQHVLREMPERITHL